MVDSTKFLVPESMFLEQNPEDLHETTATFAKRSLSFKEKLILKTSTLEHLWRLSGILTCTRWIICYGRKRKVRLALNACDMYLTTTVTLHFRMNFTNCSTITIGSNLLIFAMMQFRMFIFHIKLYW